MVTVFIFSAQSGEVSNSISNFVADILQIGQSDPHLDASLQPWLFGLSLRQYAHILLFGLMRRFVFLSLDSSKLFLSRAVFTAAICYAYACADEMHQVFVPAQTDRFSDTLLDLLGILISRNGRDCELVPRKMLKSSCFFARYNSPNKGIVFNICLESCMVCGEF